MRYAASARIPAMRRTHDRRLVHRLLALLFFCALAPMSAHSADVLEVGSKRFTESYILAEIVVRAAGGPPHAIHKPGLGNTGILHAALRTGSIDL